jgi:hypothetical protein
MVGLPQKTNEWQQPTTKRGRCQQTTKKSLLETVVDSNSNKKTLLSLLSFQICVP